MKFGEGSGVSSTERSSFSDIIKEAINNIEALENTSSSDGVDLALGNVDDLAQLQINSMKAETMVQTAVQVTTRVVNAYREIMQMNV